MKPTVLLLAALPILTLPLPAWSGSEPDARNRSTFQVAAVREIANDWVSARLSVVAESKEAAVVADSVNKAMAQALERAKKDKSVDVRSGAYVTQPVYDDGRVVRWRARQELVLEAKDVDRLANRGFGYLVAVTDHAIGLGQQRVFRLKIHNTCDLENQSQLFRSKYDRTCLPRCVNLSTVHFDVLAQHR